ncbi:CopG domain protein DNA-binding domain protein (plasmid) [Caldicellulosiruptor acetigenus I77R1B]|uniref:CopG domain protein DNA-binding domain protein n=1 Tax=Caldicellulosiruptor acetigenus (strain ATCC 700853 / DSM 12137 / I77R1B) TaxID=632335 RepID=E4SAY3_CALA7|nr:ribbon-helix-helix protein, CopG family [Caldicellulosiruptor acetigenus]ADQ42062.1 CopG domain protein DNA-binding domain protein [Caldicellulosiruptor acetigenus I77R1B]
MEKMKSVNLKLPLELFKEVEELAKRKGQTKSGLIRFVIAEYVEREKTKHSKIKDKA